MEPDTEAPWRGLWPFSKIKVGDNCLLVSALIISRYYLCLHLFPFIYVLFLLLAYRNLYTFVSRLFPQLRLVLPRMTWWRLGFVYLLDKNQKQFLLLHEDVECRFGEDTSFSPVVQFINQQWYSDFCAVGEDWLYLYFEINKYILASAHTFRDHSYILAH